MYWYNTGPDVPWEQFASVVDQNGSMETYGAQLTFVARRAGTYRVRVRGRNPSGSYCPRYEMGVTKGVTDYYVPPAIH